MEIVLLPIKERLSENTEFITDPSCAESLEMSVLFFARVGYSPPWIGYYASLASKVVGSGAFKGRPMYGKVEIAYGTFPEYQKMGIGTMVCRELVALAKKTDPSVIITARTLREENYSTRILRRNNFILQGVVEDPDDGLVWEWHHRGGN